MPGSNLARPQPAPDSAPLVLAVECATPWLGLALLRGNRCLASWRTQSRRPASELLLGEIAALLDGARATPDQLEGFAVSIGPGSFTGLRVGVATVKGLAFGRRSGVVAVPTLEALAHTAAPRPPRLRVPVLDARRDEVFLACYDGEGQTVVEPSVVRLDALDDALPPGPLTVVGDAAEPVGAALAGRDVEVVAPPAGAPDPVAVGRLGLEGLRAGRGLAPGALTPFYLRRAEAEVRRTGERFEPGLGVSR